MYFVVPRFYSKMPISIGMVSHDIDTIKQFFNDNFRVDLDNIMNLGNDNFIIMDDEDITRKLNKLGWCIMMKFSTRFHKKMKYHFDIQNINLVNEFVDFYIVASNIMETKEIIDEIRRELC